jgi:DNA-directed RNA polymerase subunit F
MIKSNEALSMAEAYEYIEKDENADSELKGIAKKFVKIKPKKAKELREKIVALELMKVRDEHVAKIIDLLPESSEELSKIFTDVGLDEDETNKILSTIKEFK